jgi:hypothetical protein
MQATSLCYAWSGESTTGDVVNHETTKQTTLAAWGREFYHLDLREVPRTSTPSAHPANEFMLYKTKRRR